MMKRSIEQGSKPYNVQRALTLHDKLLQVLNDKAQSGEVFLAGANRRGELCIAPVTPIYDPLELDEFQAGLFFGMEPDLKALSVNSYLGKKGGLSFGLFLFDNVPGFINIKGRVVPDPFRLELADYNKLEELAARVEKHDYELVKRSKILTIPDHRLAMAIMEADKLGIRWRAGLNEEELKALKTNSADFILNLKGEIRQLSDPSYVPDLKFIAASHRDSLRPITGVRI